MGHQTLKVDKQYIKEASYVASF